jgi:GDPmannose 4,6-dehydratase
MWMMLQHDTPGDYVLATNETHSVREFVEPSFAQIGVEIEWRGKGVDEVGYDKDSGAKRIMIDEKFYRPTEVEFLLGDPAKAKKTFGWEPTTKFDELVAEMVKADIELMKPNSNA